MTRPPHIPPPRIPDVPADTVMTLEAGEWSDYSGAPVGGRVHLRLIKIYASITREQWGHLWVWVAGHDSLSCHWSSVEPHGPCMELMVRVDVLGRHGR